jgi:SEC-C motif-containing protein
MRSRYTAFVLEREDYLLRSWHTSCRPASVEFDPQAKWLGLEVRRATAQDANHTEVEFVARQRLPGGAHRLHECSRFVREDGQWYYLNGDAR